MRLTTLWLAIGMMGGLMIGALSEQMQSANAAVSSGNGSAVYNQTQPIFETGVNLGTYVWPLVIIVAAVVGSLFVLYSASPGGR